jgi:hypothetical protein
MDISGPKKSDIASDMAEDNILRNRNRMQDRGPLNFVHYMVTVKSTKGTIASLLDHS